VEGAIGNVPRCKAVVLAGLDAWNQLPVLALWFRKAVASGAGLVVIGSWNGLFRDTAQWLRTPAGSEAEVAEALRAALDGQQPSAVGEVSAEEIAAAAATLSAVQGPAVLLAAPSVVASREARETFEALATRLGAHGESGMVGAPGLAANARGAQDLAPGLARADALAILAAAANGKLSSLLLLGDEAWAELDSGSARLVVATARPVPNDPRVDVMLPLAHPYERQASITNLEGRVQYQEGGAAAPPHARPDWAVLADLAKTLGVDVPSRLEDVRAAIAAAVPARVRAFSTVSSEAPLPAREAGVKRG
jgi:NADH dehydrogenase/NADH:ubiquinone oxidoreductase subunit G